MAPERLERVALYESREIVPLTNFSDGVYKYPLQVEGNSILSSVYIHSIDVGATVLVEYYDSTTGTSQGEEYPLENHPLLSAVGTNRILITRVHNKPVIRITVTGGNAEFGIYVTVISSFASELDSALVFHLQNTNLTADKGIIVVGYNPDTGKYEFANIKNGKLQVDANLTVNASETETVEHVSMPLANTEYSYTLPANTKSYMVKTQSGYDFKYSPHVGQSNTKFLTLPVYESPSSGIKSSLPRVIYFQSTRAGEIMEISSWV